MRKTGSVNSFLEHKIKLCDVDGLRESNFEQKVQEKKPNLDRRIK